MKKFSNQETRSTWMWINAKPIRKDTAYNCTTPEALKQFCEQCFVGGKNVNYDELYAAVIGWKDYE